MTKFIAIMLGWQEAEDVETGELVVWHDACGVHFTGPDAWRNAVRLSLGRS